MPVEIDRASLVKSARGYGSRGADMPDWAKGDDELEAAYHDGAGTTPDPSPEPAPEDTPKPATSGRKPPTRQSRRPAPTSSGTGRRASTTTTTTGTGTPKPERVGDDPNFNVGSVGGVLVAAFLYPIALAFLEAGPSGAAQWLAAKFINKGASVASSSTTPSTSTTAPLTPLSSAPHNTRRAGTS